MNMLVSVDFSLCRTLPGGYAQVSMRGENSRDFGTCRADCSKEWNVDRRPQNDP
jgi:hypothetical protein